MTILDQAVEWSRGRWWQWRAALLLYFAWDGIKHLRDPEAGGIFAGITFGVHEFGHLLFAFFGEFMTIAGGSLNQLLIPIATGLLFYHYRDFFGIAGAGVWLASSLMDLGRYIGDATQFDLDLVGFGEDAQHDWAWLLGRFGALGHASQLEAITRGAGAVVLLVSLLFGAWLCVRIWAAHRSADPRAS